MATTVYSHGHDTHTTTHHHSPIATGACVIQINLYMHVHQPEQLWDSFYHIVYLLSCYYVNIYYSKCTKQLSKGMFVGV